MNYPTVSEATTTERVERPSFLWFWISAALVLVLDLVSKAIVMKSMPVGGRHVEVLGEFFRLRHIRNSGGLFGVLPGNAIYFAVVSVIAVAVILWVLYRSPTRARLQQIALGLVFGGALGNFHDRIRYQEVVDFLDFGIGTNRWPTFNIADSGVTVGVCFLVLWLFLTERRNEKESADDVDESAGSEPRAADGTS